MPPRLGDGVGKAGGVMRNYAAVDKRTAKLVKTLLRYPFGRAQQGRLHALDTRLDQRKRPRAQRVETEHRAVAGLGKGGIDSGFGKAVGDDFQGGDHIAILDKLVVLDAGQRDTLIDAIELFQPLTVEPDKAPPDSVDVDAAGRGGGHAQPVRHQCRGQPVSRAVLIKVPGLKPRHRDRRDAGRHQPRDVGLPQPGALADAAIAKIDAVGKDSPRAILRCRRSELHVEMPFRSTAIISARIETAISAGVLAPISSPTGP